MHAATKIEHAIIYLLTNYNYYGQFHSRTQRIYTKDYDFVPTMGIAITTEGIKIYINEYFVTKQFTIPELAGILAHEVEHGLRNHLEREKGLEGDLRSKAKGEKEDLLERFKKNRKAYLLNLAEDIAINQDLPLLPKQFKLFDSNGNAVKNDKGEEVIADAASLEQLRKSLDMPEIQEKQAMEYYYKYLKHDDEQNGGKGEPQIIMLPFDDHNILRESLEKIDKDLANKIMQKIANESLKAAKATGAGNVPGHLELLIDKLNQSSVDWKQELRMFRTNCSSTEVEPTNKKRNRRYGLVYPGYRLKDITTIAVILDSSGSTSEYWKQFFSEIKSMAETGVNIVFIECDAQVQHVCKITEDFEPKIKGGGGTLFKPAFDLIASAEFERDYGKVTGAIYMTDGDNFDAKDLQEPDYKVAWVLPKGCRSNYTWGEKIEITLKEENQ
jgi:predicted metal-dependent peptidase